MKKYLVVGIVEVDEDYLRFPNPHHPTQGIGACLQAAYHDFQRQQGGVRPANVDASTLKITQIQEIV